MVGKAHPKPKDSMTSLSRTPQRWLEMVPWNEAFVWIFSSQGGLGSWDDSENNLLSNSSRFREKVRPTWHSARQKKKTQKNLLVPKEVSPVRKDNYSLVLKPAAQEAHSGVTSHTLLPDHLSQEKEKMRGCINYVPELAGSPYPSDNSLHVPNFVW